MVVVTSSYAIIKNAAINSKKEELLANYKDIRSNLIRYEMLTKDTAKLAAAAKNNCPSRCIREVRGLSAGDVRFSWDISGEKIERQGLLQMRA